MTTTKRKSILALLLVLILCSSVWAQWTVPVPVDEVNADYTDKTPFLSFDGLTLYFSRADTDTFHYARIYKANRPEPCGPFTTVEEISELNYSGGHVRSPWVSPDNLRMYFIRTEPGPGGGSGRIKLSERDSAENPWPVPGNISELNCLCDIRGFSLTQDELTIVFYSSDMPGGEGYSDLYIATRPDIDSSFENIQNLSEVNTSASENAPFLSPNGLLLCFCSNRNGDTSQLFVATRSSLDEPFSNVEHLEFFDMPDGSFDPSISADGQTFYFVSTGDIYVSYGQEEGPATYYVDGVNGSDDNDGLTLETAFATIQKGIDEANDADTVLVYPAVYGEAIDFASKAITVQGVPTEAGAPTIEAPMDYAVSFYTWEEPNSVLKNFCIQNSFVGIFLAGASPTLGNLTIIDNDSGVAAYAGADPDITNCIFYNNTEDLFGCQARYSWIQETQGSNPNLVGWWKFDEGSGSTAYDSAGTNDGTIYNATWTTGIIDGALDFDGDDAVYIEGSSGTGSELNIYNSDLTISSWVRIAGPGGTIVARAKTLAIAYNIGVSTGRAYINTYRNGPGHWHLFTDEIISLDTWCHIVGVFDRDQDVGRVYVNGIEEANGPMTTDPVSNDASTKIGCRNDVTDRGFDGNIDDVRIYDRALSAEEIQALYEAGLGPMFADANSGDYHLLSERGRYWPQHDVWVLDDVTSPCVDGGDPNIYPADEPMPNGGRINMGAYGGTAYAGMSEWPLAEDTNRDGIVNMLDFASLADKWLEKLSWAQ